MARIHIRSETEGVQTLEVWLALTHMLWARPWKQAFELQHIIHSINDFLHCVKKNKVFSVNFHITHTIIIIIIINNVWRAVSGPQVHFFIHSFFDFSLWKTLNILKVIPHKLEVINAHAVLAQRCSVLWKLCICIKPKMALWFDVLQKYYLTGFYLQVLLVSFYSTCSDYLNFVDLSQRRCTITW